MQTEETISAFIILLPKLGRTIFIPELHSLPDTVIVNSVMLLVYADPHTHSYHTLTLSNIPQEMETILYLWMIFTLF